jgi:hypothetical protein
MGKYNFGQGLPTWNGVPMVDSANFAGFWGSDVWFVDGDDGSNGNKGKDSTKAFSTVTKAISSASAGDTIYVKPRVPQSDASDPNVYAEDIEIAYAKNNLSIIGTRTGHDTFYGPKLKLGTATETVDVYAPAFSLENFTIHRRGSNTKAIYLRGVTGYATAAGSVASHISNCMIRYGSPVGIYVYAGYHSNVNNCTFWGNDISVHLDGSGVPQRGMQVNNCSFNGANGSVSAGPDIRMQGASTEVVVDRCIFDDIPTSTTYITATGVVDGKITECYFCAGTDTVNAQAADGEIQLGSGTLSIAGCFDGNSAIVDSA